MINPGVDTFVASATIPNALAGKRKGTGEYVFHPAHRNHIATEFKKVFGEDAKFEWVGGFLMEQNAPFAAVRILRGEDDEGRGVPVLEAYVQQEGATAAEVLQTKNKFATFVNTLGGELIEDEEEEEEEEEELEDPEGPPAAGGKRRRKHKNKKKTRKPKKKSRKTRKARRTRKHA